MNLHGNHFIAGQIDVGSGANFRGVNPATSQLVGPDYFEATPEQIDRALRAAAEAFAIYRKVSPEKRAAFLETIASNIETVGDDLLQQASLETGLGLDRLAGERARTVGQLRLFAKLILEGSWVDARIDRAMPNRKPMPRADLRRMLVPIGPVVVFGASNFPLAFSVSGGDTASALAAGCPVVVKAHPSHPGTSEMVASAIVKAAEQTGMPADVFSMVHGRSVEVGRLLVEHPLTEAVAFTGSQRGGRALFDAAARRARPIPVFAEMGSSNPVFVLPGALAERGQAIADGLKVSVTMGVGQFCTNPGMVVGLEDAALQSMVDRLAQGINATAPATMLNAGIRKAFVEGATQRRACSDVSLVSESRESAEEHRTQASATLLKTSGKAFLQEPLLGEELFGPSTIVITSKNREEMVEIARNLHGHLTATVHGTAQDLTDFSDLIDLLQQKVGRLVFNGFPTGVEVCQAMHHGGPYPATTDARTTSVGAAAIERFVRPVCWQDCPQVMLPDELKDENPRNIWRIVDDQRTRDSWSA